MRRPEERYGKENTPNQWRDVRAMAALIKSVGTAGSGVGGGGGPIYAKNQKKWHSTPGGDQGAGM